MVKADIRKVQEMSVRLWKKTLSLLLIVCLVSGCTTLRPLSSEPKMITGALRPGDNVRVTMRDGRVLKFTVEEITERSISGEKELVALTDILQIDHREFSPGKTAGLIGGMAVTAFIICAIVFFASIARNGL